MKFQYILLIVSLVFFGCQEKEQKPVSINGVWESIGSGWVLHIQDSSDYAFYDVTSISCLPARQAEMDEIIESVSIENDTLHLLRGVMTYQFKRMKELPELCAKVLPVEKKADVFYNFDVFAETVKAHYAFMELNQINWAKLYAQQKDKLSENPSDIQLYKVLDETLTLLNDNHAYLEASEAVYQSLEQLENEEQEDAPTDNLPEYGDFQIANMVSDHYLKKDMTKDSWLIKWGKMEENIGYIQVKAMWLYADLEMPQSLIDSLGYVDAYIETFYQMNEGKYIEKEVKGVRVMMDKVMQDLKDSRSIVIDLRFNGGGQDAVSFEILKRFNPEKRQIVTTKLKHQNSFSPQQPLFLEAHPNPYTHPVYLLTSQQTGSAAEAFAISSMAIPHFKRIGTATQGALSTALEKQLPNGWVFSISNEIYMDRKGNSYENIGIPVNYSLNYPEDRQTFFRSIADNLEKDKLDVLKAIHQLKKNENVVESSSKQ